MKLATKLSLLIVGIVALVSVGLELANFLVFSSELRYLNWALLSEKVDRLTLIAREQDELIFEGVYSSEDEPQKRIVDKLRIIYRKDKGSPVFPFIITTKGEVVIHPLEERGAKIFSEEDLDFILRQKDGEIRYMYKGVKQWCVFKTFKPWNWVFCMSMPLAYKHKAIFSSVRVAAAISLVIIIMVIGLVVILSRGYIHPINLVIRRMESIAKGEIAASAEDKLAVDKRDEIGMLVRAVTKMADDLKRTTVSRDALSEEIEERKKAQDELMKSSEELKRMHVQLVQSEKLASIGQLAAGVAHEINNPAGFIGSNLNTLEQYAQIYSRIFMMLESLKKAVREKDFAAAERSAGEIEAAENEVNMDFVSGDIDNLLKESKRGLDRIRKIVNDLRSFTRDDSGQEELVRVEDVIESILGIVSTELKYKAELKKEYADTGKINCYVHQMGQVFINMLVNAAQAIEDKGEITVKTYQKDNTVFVEVSDTGKGIAKENLFKIFDPFYTTKPVGMGTGLGLSISYDIIKKHGGDIKVSSEPGKGSTFTITLPLAA